MISRHLRIALSAICGAAVQLASSPNQGSSVPRCYLLQVGPWSGPLRDLPSNYHPPQALRLDTMPDPGHFHRGMLAQAIPPSASLPTGYWLIWWRAGPDTIHVVETNGESGVDFRLNISRDTLRGVANSFADLIGPRYPTAEIVATPITCPVPLAHPRSED
jgi:hypothetical protein